MESNDSYFTSNYDYDYSDTYYDYSDYSHTYNGFTEFFYINIEDVITCVIISIGLPLTLFAIYSLYSLVKNDNVAPIFIINLLISDTIQFCCMIVEVTKPEGGETYLWYQIDRIIIYIYLFGLMTSAGFMVCIALERYLVIARPLWCHFRSTIKISLVVCVVVWILPLAVVLPIYLGVVLVPIFAIFLLVPFPLLIFFLVGTLKALSAAISVPSDEKRRIVIMLVLVLLIYTLLYLPAIILHLSYFTPTFFFFPIVKRMLLKFSPLADLILASLCCCRMNSDDNSRSSASISMKDNNMFTVCSMQIVKEGEREGRRQAIRQLKREETTVTVLYQQFFPIRHRTGVSGT